MPTARPGGGHPQSPRARSGARLAAWLLPVLPLVLALLVHRRALGAFFSVDDFVRLEEASGLLPASATLWRLVSEVLYVKLMLGLFGPRPLPFHIVSLALHLANTAFVYRMARKAGLGAAASCLAASAFGAFPLFYTVLLSAVNINDILALTLVFAALLALEAPSAARAAIAVACFALALLSKEAVLFVPFAALLLPLAGERRVATARRLAPLLATGVVFAGLYLAFRKHGLGTGGSAYAVGFGANLFHNLMTYAYWSIDLARTVPDARGLLDPGAWRIGMWPVALLALGAALSPARRATIVFGCAWWLLGLVPVLPLVAHTYGHYLYIPIAGFAIAAAAVVEALASGAARLWSRERGGPAFRPSAGESRPRAAVGAARAAGAARASGASRAAAEASRPAPRGLESALVPGICVLLALGFAARSEILLRQRVSARLGSTELALDPFTRKMEVARRAVSTLSGQLDRGRDTVVVFTPPGLGRAISANTGKELAAMPAGVPSYDVVEGVLGGGVALRLFEPRLDSVVFVSRWTPDYKDFTLFTEGPAGRLVMLGRGVRSHTRFGGALVSGGFNAQARDYLAEVIKVYPDDRLTRLLYAVALSGSGEPDSARANAARLIEGAPPDTISATARKLITILDTRKK